MSCASCNLMIGGKSKKSPKKKYNLSKKTSHRKSPKKSPKKHVMRPLSKKRDGFFGFDTP